MSLAKYLRNIDTSLKELNKKVDILVDMKKEAHSLKLNQEDFDYFFKLPDHLRKTLLTVIELNGKVVATDVSRLTKRARPVESSYLNQLVRLGYLTSYKDGRATIFILKKRI